MKNEKIKIEKIFPNPFSVGEIIFIASSEPKTNNFKMEMTDEAKLAKVRQELRELNGKR